MSPPAERLPEADYVVLASRVAPGLDGGFAVAVPWRMRLLAASGADPMLLTLDAGSAEDHTRQRRELVEAGLLAPGARVRNLFDEVRQRPGWLDAVGEPGSFTPGVQYRPVTDATGRTVVSLPVYADDPAWYTRDDAVVVHAPGGDRVLPGFGGLYLAWLDTFVGARPLVVVCESRQTGELLARWDDPRVRIVHTVHNSHLPAPYDDPDAPLAPPWQRWLDVVHRFDAVLWPTAAQRHDVARRFGDDPGFHVVPNPIELGDEPRDAASRDPRLVVMLNRLAPQKRVDLALRAWVRVVEAVPDARLEIYGDGPLRGDLAALVGELGLEDAVRLCGATSRRDEIFEHAALFASSTAFEGQGLSTAEALARGLPVVSFDVRYGPREAVGGGGVLVEPGDVDAWADAVIALLVDDDRRERMSRAAREAAHRLSLDAVRPAFVAAVTAAVGAPGAPGAASRRTLPAASEPGR